MKKVILNCLKCTRCEGGERKLDIVEPVWDEGEIRAGRLVCKDGHAFPIIDFVADFVDNEETSDKSRLYDTLWDIHEKQVYAGREEELIGKFQDFSMLPGPPEDYFRDRLVLDVGC